LGRRVNWRDGINRRRHTRIGHGRRACKGRATGAWVRLSRR
jgi:hypothetical protein